MNGEKIKFMMILKTGIENEYLSSKLKIKVLKWLFKKGYNRQKMYLID